MAEKNKINIKSKKRIIFVFAFLAILLIVLLFRTAWIQVVKNDEYTDIAKDQQKSDIPIAAKRGSIYDRNGEELASSATCYTLWIRPSQIREEYPGQKLNEVANQIAVVLGMESNQILDYLNSEQVLVKAAKYLEKGTADKLSELNISGLEIAEDTKRFYPMNSFASNLLGSVNDEGEGRSGIEYQYNEYLSGTAGRAVMDTDVNGNKLSNGSSKYYEAKDGLNVELTIDEVLQHYLENAVEKGMKDTGADRISAIAIDPKTGEVLAMAINPAFNPNDPTKPVGEEALSEFQKLDVDGKSAYLSRMWSNALVSDVYEPGSTFKLITSSSSLEEGLVTPETPFYCKGFFEIAGMKFYDAERKAHGGETLMQAVGQSCNPVHMQLALNMGKEKFYEYLKEFGMMERTGIDFPGESAPLVTDISYVGPVELGTMGFGQGIAITPIELITAVSAIGNDGVLMKPHFVRRLTDKDGKTVVEYKPIKVRKVLSGETCNEMLNIMEQQVEQYGGKTGRIPGYRIGGKTGTSSKAINGVYSNETDTSFVSMAPIDDPKIAVLVVCNSPNQIYADITAIPIVKNFLEKALPYLNVKSSDETQKPGEKQKNAYVPELTGYSYKKAKEILDEYGLKYEVRPALTEDEKKDEEFDFTIVDQYPKAGKKIDASEKIYLYRK
ncbi:MAG: penicillin-binding transpeptidase domain-containing protein [Eubacterium sp.]|nr:penicillin-binding transpeptidase domain-containing protein [Eubacterium sp.]